VEPGCDSGGRALAPVEAIERLPDADLASVRGAVVASGYAFDTLAEAERVAPHQLDAVRLPLVRWWLARRPDRAALLARLFAYDDRVPAGAAAAALGDAALRTLCDAGIASLADGHVESRLRLTPLEGLLLLSDPPDAGADAVMGPGPTTVALARCVPRAPGAVLDLGCGAGTLALVAAARGAVRAMGVDLSARAVALARVNARLNGLAAEFREGDLLEPVRGEAFDLAVSQPPYVPLPDGVSPTVYLHGGARGDELPLRFAAALPAALARGGRAVLLYDAPAGGPRPNEALRAALGDAAVDLVVLAAPGPSADLEAVAFAAVEDRTLGAGYAAAVARYREHLAAIGAASFSRALAVLRAADRPGGRMTVELAVPSLSGVGAATLDRYLAALDLAAAPEPALLAAAVRPAPEARLREERAPGGPSAAVAVRFEPGWIAADRELSEAGAFLLDALAGAASVDAAAARFAEAAEAAPDEARRTVVPFVREGLSRGILVPA
jgi:SAM-dependent methyltransferase